MLSQLLGCFGTLELPPPSESSKHSQNQLTAQSGSWSPNHTKWQGKSVHSVRIKRGERRLWIHITTKKHTNEEDWGIA